MTDANPRSIRASATIALTLMALAVGPAALTAWLHPSAPTWIELASNSNGTGSERIDVATARRDFKEALWLDARSAVDFSRAHVPGALPLTEDSWEDQLIAVMEKWDGRQPMLVYCGGASCQASEAVARRLRRELGEVKVWVLEGGWDAWQKGESSP